MLTKKKTVPEKPAVSAKKMSSQIIKIDDFRNFMSYMPNPDITLSKSNEGLSVYEEMDTDGRLSSLFRLRRGATLGLPMRFNPSGESKVDEFIKTALPPTFLRRLSETLMNALKFGYQPVEIIWKQLDSRWWVPDFSKRHPSEYFYFDAEGHPYLMTAVGNRILDRKYKLLIHRNEGSNHDDYYGKSIYSPCYWTWEFKRMGWQFWVMATEKFSVPTLLALFETEDENKAEERAGVLADLIQNIQSGSAGALANIKEIKQIETKGGLTGFKTLVETCNAEMSYAITGQSLATGEAEYGTRSQGEVHERVLNTFVEHDAMDLCLTIQELVGWVIDLNFPGAPVPSIEIDTGDYASWDQVKDALELGVPVSRHALYSIYGLPKPEDEEDNAQSEQTESSKGNAGVKSENLQATALNGAQVTALVELAKAAVNKEVPLETARAMASAAFPLVAKEIIDSIFDPLVNFEGLPEDEGASFADKPTDNGFFLRTTRTR